MWTGFFKMLRDLADPKKIFQLILKNSTLLFNAFLNQKLTGK